MLRTVSLMLLFITALFINSRPAAAQAPTALADAVVAVVDGKDIKASDLDAFSRTADARQLFLLNQQLQDSRRPLVDSLNDERLLGAEARRAGVTVEQLLNRLKVSPVTEAEILRSFQEIQAQNPGVVYQSMLPAIRMLLQGQHRSEARAKYLKELRRALR